MIARKLQSAAKAVEPVYVEDTFSTYLYTGNGSTQTITNEIDLSGKGGLVWIKSRSDADSHSLFDNLHGTTKFLASNLTNGLITAANNVIDQYNSNGFQLNQGSGLINQNTKTYVSWTFRKQAKFFDCFTYTGTGSSLTLSHSLGSTPGCIILKRTDTASTFGWLVWHRSVGANNLRLNSTEAAGATFANQVSSVTSTQFTIGTTGDINANGGTYVAYLFAHDAGGFGLSGSDNVISCGSYSGAGSAQSISLGYEPQWIIIKRSSGGTGSWYIWDTMRGMVVGGNDPALAAESSSSETSVGTFNAICPTATGFTLETGGASYPGWNDTGSTYIYIAIRRGPMKTPTTGTSVYNAIAADANGVATGIVTDAGFIRILGNVSAPLWGTRLTGTNTLNSSSTAAETSYANLKWDKMNGFWNSISGYFGWGFRRAPGFFDVVCYTGTGVSLPSLTHNLGVVPEIIIYKKRTGGTEGWFVYLQALGTTKTLYLNTNDAEIPIGSWTNTPTSTQFTAAVNDSGSTYVAYLFASLPGISKVGTYTGTGNTLQIDCGFTGGARLVLVKRTDSTGDWLIWDSARGIVSGNDPYLELNTTDAEVTNTDWVDTYSAGFELSDAAGNNANINTATYIFLAIA